MTSRTSRDLRDVNSAFAVTPETGIVYVWRPETLDQLQDENITVSLFISVNETHDDDDGDYDYDYKAERSDSQPVAPPRRWLPVANISVYVERAEADYNVTSPARRT